MLLRPKGMADSLMGPKLTMWGESCLIGPLCRSIDCPPPLQMGECLLCAEEGIVDSHGWLPVTAQSCTPSSNRGFATGFWVSDTTPTRPPNFRRQLCGRRSPRDEKRPRRGESCSRALGSSCLLGPASSHTAEGIGITNKSLSKFSDRHLVGTKIEFIVLDGPLPVRSPVVPMPYRGTELPPHVCC